MKKSLEVLEKVKEYLTEEDYNSMEFDLLCEALADKFKEEFSVSLKMLHSPKATYLLVCTNFCCYTILFTHSKIFQI